MQHFVIDGDRATYRYRPFSFAGGSCLVAGIICALMNMVPLFMMLREKSEIEMGGGPVESGWRLLYYVPVFVFPNLLLALVGLAGACFITTAVVDKKSREVIVQDRIVPPFGLPVYSFKKEVFNLAKYNYVKLDRTVTRRRSPTLTLRCEHDGVQLMGANVVTGELVMIAEETAKWVGWELKDE